MTQFATVISVDVVYAEADRAISKTYRLSTPATLLDALRIAAADPDFGKVDINAAPVGIHGRLASPTQPLAEGDRVEIYRPLAADPKTARRARVEQARRRRQ